MPYSSGAFTLAAGNPVVTGTVISSTTHNNTNSDIATGLSTALLKDGSQTVTANIPMNAFKLTGLASGTATGQSLRWDDVFSTAIGPFNDAAQATVASAATTNLDTATSNYVQITGTTTITAITLTNGRERTVEFAGALTLTNGASFILPGGANITTAAGDTAIFRGEAAGVVRCIAYTPASGVGTPKPQSANTVLAGPSSGAAAAPTFRSLVPADMTPSTFTNSLAADVNLNATGSFFSGPVVSQGTTGTFLCFGTITALDTAGIAQIVAKLHDGTTIIDMAVGSSPTANFGVAVSVSGVITNPTGNIRIDVADASANTGVLKAALSGSKNSTLTVVRIG